MTRTTNFLVHTERRQLYKNEYYDTPDLDALLAEAEAEERRNQPLPGPSAGMIRPGQVYLEVYDGVRWRPMGNVSC